MNYKITAVLIYLLTLFAVLHIPAPVMAEQSFSITSSAIVVQPGESFTVTLEGEVPDDLRSYEVVLTYDHDKLELIGNRNEQAGAWYAIGPKEKLNKTYFGFIQTSAEGGSNEADHLSTFTFKAKTSGSAQIGLDSVTWFDSKAEEHTHRVNTSLIVAIESDGKSDESNSSEGSTMQTPTTGANSSVISLSPKWIDGEAVSMLDLMLINNAFDNTQPNAEGIKEVSIKVSSITGANRYTLQLPSSLVSSPDRKRNIRLVTPLGIMLIPDQMLKETDTRGKEQIEISMGMVDKGELGARLVGLIGNRPIIELHMKAGEELIVWENNNVPVTVMLSYEPTARELEKQEHLGIWYIQGKNEATPVPNGAYDSVTKQVIFSTTHFSAFAVGYAEKSFDDIAEYTWAKKEIEVLASKGIINGITEKAYAPNRSITRADFVLLLVRSLELKAKVAKNFDDVRPEDYYYEALGIARTLGLAKGREYNRFYPDQYITRQEMIVLADRALTLANRSIGRGDITDLNPFVDAHDLADYAILPVAAMVKERMIQGHANQLNPLHETTRAEAAFFIYRLYSKK